MTPPGRTLLVLRHAKSAWPDGVADLDRPLTERGRRSCAAVGALLVRAALAPSAVLCSPARRAVDTARAVLDAAGLPDRVPIVEPRLYDAPGAQVHYLLGELDDDDRTVLFVGHEPELVRLVHTLSGAVVRLPTAALAILGGERSWTSMGQDGAELVGLYAPRLLG
ncbi:MAG: histidine phosphatase family protein [Acidimicrobiia bacterium]|nr:histidine phosphatase family protein [Acidimicrobiia bacterium]